MLRKRGQESDEPPGPKPPADQLQLSAEELEVTCGGGEHSVVLVPEGVALPEVGSRLYLVPGHVDPTFNMHDALVCVRRDEDKPLEAAPVEGVFPIEARGAGF